MRTTKVSIMLHVCPHEKGLLCSGNDRTDEYFRQMMEALLENKPAYFVTGSECAAYAQNCLKLRAYREKRQNQR